MDENDVISVVVFINHEKWSTPISSWVKPLKDGTLQMPNAETFIRKLSVYSEQEQVIESCQVWLIDRYGNPE